MSIDIANLRHSFKKEYNIDIANEEMLKHSIELFVQLKINTDPEYMIPTIINSYSFIKDYNLYMKKLNESIQFNENAEIIRLKSPFLNKYKDELFLAINPISFKQIKYTRKHFYFLYYREIVDTIDIVLNKEIKTTGGIDYLLKKYDYLFEDKELLSSFANYKRSLFDLSFKSNLLNLFNPLKGICSRRYLKGTKEVSEMRIEEKNIELFFKNSKIEFPEMIKFYQERLLEFNDEQKTKALFFLDYVVKELIKRKK